MPIESATYVDDLNSSNPLAGDLTAQGDDHIRLIKAVLLATFPGLTGAVTATQTELNQLHTGTRTLGIANGSSGSPSVYFDSDTDLGLYRYAANQLGIAGRLIGNGAIPVGSIQMFPKAPSSLGTTNTDTGKEYLECRGTVYSVADYPDLGAFLGSTYGGNGTTTFGVPDMYTSGQFPRSRTASVTVSTAQTNQNAAHTHTFSATSSSNGDHVHTTSITDSGHTHTVSAPTNAVYVSGGVGSLTAGANGATTSSITIAGATTGIAVEVLSNGAHTHTVSGTSGSSGGTEARPEAISFVFAVKT